MTRVLLAVLLFASSIIAMSSCRTNKNIAYFRDIPDTIYTDYKSINVPDTSHLTIKADDLLQISIQSIDPELNNLFGTSNKMAFDPNNVSNNSIPSTFLVSKEGYIELPLAGRLYVNELTTSQVSEMIHSKALPYYKDPVVNVRLANFRVTVLGEVAKPGTYIMTNEQVTLLDAIGMAGDLTIYAKRENVLLVRKENDEKHFIRYNLNSSDLFLSPYYNLKQGDVIYIEPNKSKIATTDGAKTRTYSLLAAGASVLIVLLTRINF